MPEIYNDVTKIKILPMHRLMISVGDSTSGFQYHWFERLEADSTWALYQITQRTDEGGDRVVAYKIEATGTVPYNNYRELLPALAFIANKRMTDLDILLQSQQGQTSGGSMWITFDNPIKVKKYSVTWRIDQAEMRPRLTFKVTGYLSKDAMTNTSTSPVFT